MKKDTLRVSYAHAVFGDEERRAVQEVLSSPQIVAGKRAAEFESKIASLFKKKYGLLVNSGSSANLMAIESLDLPEGSEVITPVLTFATTVSPIVKRRLVPVFVDVDPRTYQIDADKVEGMIGKKTKAIIVPSLFGNIPDLPKLRRIANKHKLYLIEDSCDTLGATVNGKSTGSFADISTTSFMRHTSLRQQARVAWFVSTMKDFTITHVCSRAGEGDLPSMRPRISMCVMGPSLMVSNMIRNLFFLVSATIFVQPILLLRSGSCNSSVLKNSNRFDKKRIAISSNFSRSMNNFLFFLSRKKMLQPRGWRSHSRFATMLLSRVVKYARFLRRIIFRPGLSLRATC